MYLQNLKYNFSIKQISTQRTKFQHKICFKKSLEHLKLKSTPTISVVTRVIRDGKFLKFYKKIHKSFFLFLLPNIYKLSDNNEFKNLFFQYQSFNNIDRVLFWKLNSINCLFNLKKLKSRKILFYLKPERRIVLILFWLKNIIKLKRKNSHNCSPKLFLPILQFISTNKSNTDVFNLKLKIYKMRLLRG